MKIGLLDDWQENAHEFADWDKVSGQHQLDIYHDTISGPALIQRLQPYDVLCLMRERTVFSADVIESLPNLKAIITSGMRNAAIDLDACKARNIVVSGTAAPGHATAELAMTAKRKSHPLSVYQSALTAAASTHLSWRCRISELKSNMSFHATSRTM